MVFTEVSCYLDLRKGSLRKYIMSKNTAYLSTWIVVVILCKLTNLQLEQILFGVNR